MIKDIWSRVTFCCGCHGGSRVPMEESDRRYVCGKRGSANGNGTGTAEDCEPECTNFVDYTTAMDIVERISNAKSQSVLSGEVTDFTNYRFTLRGVRVRVVKDSGSGIVLSVVNSRKPCRQ